MGEISQIVEHRSAKLVCNQKAEVEHPFKKCESVGKSAGKIRQCLASKLQDLVANARLLDESKLDTSKILLLSKVEIKNTKTNTKISYEIVPESEADIKKNKISVSSPIAKALLGKRVGDIVEVQVPAGTINFEVLSVQR